MEPEELVRRYTEAVAHNDLDTLTALRHPEWHEDWPQSGERVPNDAAYRQIHGAFPGGMPRADVTEIAGADDRWVVTPSMTIQRIAGSGDLWIAEGVNTYPDGHVYLVVALSWLRDGRVWRQTTYFAERFDPPGWRAPYVVPIEG
jgi:hypothetical protein